MPQAAWMSHTPRKYTDDILKSPVLDKSRKSNSNLNGNLKTSSDWDTDLYPNHLKTVMIWFQSCAHCFHSKIISIFCPEKESDNKISGLWEIHHLKLQRKSLNCLKSPCCLMPKSWYLTPRQGGWKGGVVSCMILGPWFLLDLCFERKRCWKHGSY